MITLASKDSCTGCGACNNICNHNAIRMEKDEEGFLFPTINTDQCVECHLCEQSCPVLHPDTNANNEMPKAFAVWSQRDRIYSSSGGAFSAFARMTLAEKGVVFGASFDEHLHCRHIEIQDEKELSALRGSKYVQSATGDCYKRIKDALRTGRQAYFVGTPCQVAGLRKYLHRDYDNLLTSDLICHGVPSNDLFVRQIRQLERKHGYKIKDFLFRSKQRFGQGCDLQVVTADGKSRFYNAELMPYFYGFWNNITLRPSCYVCRFANTQRASDITLGDYWLAKKEFPGVKMSKGLSLALVNTGKGQKVWNEIKSDIEWRESTLQQAERGQGQLKAPVGRPKANTDYLASYSQLDFTQCCRRYLTPSLKYTLKCHIKNAVKLLIGFKYWK